MTDYNGHPLAIGDCVMGIEDNWIAKITSVDHLSGPETMLVCLGVNWWSGETDADDTQWRAPADVVFHLPTATDPINPTNFL